MKSRFLLAMIAASSIGIGGCSGADDERQPSPQPPPAAGAAAPEEVPETAKRPDAGSAGNGKPAARVDLNTLSSTELQTIYTAIDRYVRTARISVQVAGTDVVPWEDAFDRMASVSVVRAHHAIHHSGEHFFTCHRWYLESMERSIAAALPQGRLPAWKPSNPIPAPFTSVAAPQIGGDCETLGSLATMSSKGVLCEFAYTNSYNNLRGASVTISGLENTNPRVPFPSKYLPAAICNFKSAAALADDIGAGFQRVPGFHSLVHDTIAGTMRSMDAPAAPIFWPWHATIDDIFQSWLDCKLEAPPACPVQ